MQSRLLEPSLSFFNKYTEKVQQNIWKELNNGLWTQFDINAFLYNNRLRCDFLAETKPLFEGIHQIVPGTYWNRTLSQLKLDIYSPNFIEKCSFTNFIELCANFFNNLRAKRIGVHLSGGLDSGIIMGILRYLKIDFVPIGLVSRKFEFRTEKKIQEILLSWGSDGLLIDLADYPFYSNLKDIPAHQIPDADIKSVGASRALARAFKERECDIVLSGQGGDTLLVDEVLNFKSLKFNIGNEFSNYKEQDRIYGPLGIRLISFYAEKSIIDFLCSARNGQGLDPLKLWTRQWLKELLPRELSEFSYFADFFGLTMWGLHEAKPVIKELMEEAYDISKFPHFSPKNVKRFLNQDVFSFEHKDYIQYCGLISVASWYHSLFNN